MDYIYDITKERFFKWARFALPIVLTGFESLTIWTIWNVYQYCKEIDRFERKFEANPEKYTPTKFTLKNIPEQRGRKNTEGMKV